MDEIDEIIKELDETDKEVIEEENVEVIVQQEEKKALIDLEEENALANKIVENSLNIINDAKKIFQHFSTDVIFGKDSSTSSKEAILKALEVQNSANKNMIDLAKVLSNKQDGNNTNILINTISKKKAGIDINNIKENLK